MANKIAQLSYLGWWFARARFFGRKAPLQSVLFLSDKCNLSCKHCSVYNHVNPISKSYEQVREELAYCLSLGSRAVDFEGGEPFLWRDGGKTVNELCDLAHSMGFFSCTVTTNAQMPFPDCRADSIWVSLDGLGSYHDAVRGEGSFARLEKNIASCGHKALSVSMSVNVLNAPSVGEVLEYVKDSPYIKSIAFNFHTPFEGTEELTLPQELREQVIDTIIAHKKKGYPVMNSCSGLRRMKKLDFRKRCWISNYLLTDGTRLPQCPGSITGACSKCGFSMAGEMDAVFHFCPDTILAGLDLRLPGKRR